MNARKQFIHYNLIEIIGNVNNEFALLFIATQARTEIRFDKKVARK
jgi:hypothetical protein